MALDLWKCTPAENADSDWYQFSYPSRLSLSLEICWWFLIHILQIHVHRALVGFGRVGIAVQIITSLLHLYDSFPNIKGSKQSSKTESNPVTYFADVDNLNFVKIIFIPVFDQMAQLDLTFCTCHDSSTHTWSQHYLQARERCKILIFGT